MKPILALRGKESLVLYKTFCALQIKFTETGLPPFALELVYQGSSHRPTSPTIFAPRVAPKPQCGLQ